MPMALDSVNVRCTDAGEGLPLIPPEESEKLAGVIPGAQLNVIPHAGHLIAVEQPDEFNHVLQEWLHGADFVSALANLTE